MESLDTKVGVPRPFMRLDKSRVNSQVGAFNQNESGLFLALDWSAIAQI